MKRPLIVIMLTVILDAVGIGLIFPILPRLLADVTHVGNIAPYVGVMLALYAAMQFLFSPVLGAMSDRFGRRPVLMLSLLGATVDYLLMAIAPELWMLVVGRAIAGITSANMAIATAYITDITPEADRARRFGMFHAMFGIGFVVGPALGGILGDLWVRAPFIAAAVLNGANLLLATFILPESRPGDPSARLKLSQLNPLKPLGWAVALPNLLPLMAVFLIVNFVANAYPTVWALWGTDAFAWSGLMLGLSLTGYGLLHAIVQAFLPGPVTKRFGERNALLIGLAAESVGLAIAAYATQGWIIFAIMPLFALGGVGAPALQSLATRQVGEDKQGQLQGVLASVMSLASIFGPLFFSSVYFAIHSSWPGAIWLVTVAGYVIAVPIIFTMGRRQTAGTST